MSAGGGDSPLAIIAGGGPLPLHAARAAAKAGRVVFVACLAGSARPEDYRDHAHAVFGLGQFGALRRALLERDIHDLVVLGHVTRPSFGDIRPDLGLVKHLGRLRQAFGAGDDGLLRGIVTIFESEGLTVHSVLSVAPDLAAPRGALTCLKPLPISAAEIALGRQVLGALSPFDIGQGVVVSDGRPVAVEGAEGTDAMLARVADLRARGRLGRDTGGGVLVKWPKHGQDLRLDLPTIGPRTVENAAKAGLAGIAIAAGQVLVADRTATIEAADAAGLFIEGQV